VKTGQLFAAHRTPPGSFALCESEAAAPNDLTVRKQSDSTKAPVGTEVNPHVVLSSLPIYIFLMYPDLKKSINILH